ncbi:hypothetical protein A9Q99_09445 [Gammaproteobacteria bacterium 45_16_T64]|nr:hypothetical protein A9Q99_09445 [Gammaproteobacteria bacterium 45_16_T64]
MIIIGHRGARLEAPENTLIGFRLLRSLDIHHVELDLHLSKDNKLVVIHDAFVDRTTTHKGKVNEFTAGQLHKMNAATNYRNRNIASNIPSLDDVLSEWPNLQSIQLEVKPVAREQLHILARELASIIAHYNLQTRATVTSSDINFLRYLQQQHPTIKRGFVAERFTRNPVDICRRLQCSYLILHKGRCNRELVNSAHALKLHVSVWTVNTPRTARKVAQNGVDSIITDAPSIIAPLFTG